MCRRYQLSEIRFWPPDLYPSEGSHSGNFSLSPPEQKTIFFARAQHLIAHMVKLR